MMFIPVTKESKTEGVVDLYQVDCTTVNIDTKVLFNRVRKSEVIFVTNVLFEDAILNAARLNELHFRLETLNSMDLKIKPAPVKSKHHIPINILGIKVFQMVEVGTKFVVQDKIFTVTECNNILKGKISIPYYTVVDSEGIESKRVHQDYLLSFAGISMEENMNKIAEISIGTKELQSLWLVSLSNDQKFIYTSSPTSANGYRWMRCMDMYDINCLSFVESAVARLVLEIHGPWLKKAYINKLTYTSKKKTSCKTCMASRFVSRTDTIEGDCTNPDNPSKGTFYTKIDGTYTNKFVCAYTMSCPGQDRIKHLASEQVRGYASTGHPGAYCEQDRSEALDCSRYHPKNSKYIRNDSHEVIRLEDQFIIRTAGIDLVLDTTKPVVTADMV